MNSPLRKYHIGALYLYCGKSCNVRFGQAQIKKHYNKWKWFDWCLSEGIALLSKHEPKEKNPCILYCGLNQVQLINTKEIKEGYFLSHVSTSPDRRVAEFYKGEFGCILEFDPSMRNNHYIHSCNVQWISPYKQEQEILFSRSYGIKKKSSSNKRRRRRKSRKINAYH